MGGQAARCRPVFSRREGRTRTWLVRWGGGCRREREGGREGERRGGYLRISRDFLRQVHRALFQWQAQAEEPQCTRRRPKERSIRAGWLRRRATFHGGVHHRGAKARSREMQLMVLNELGNSPCTSANQAPRPAGIASGRPWDHSCAWGCVCEPFLLPPTHPHTTTQAYEGYQIPLDRM